LKRFALIGSNVLTALVTAGVTSAFWLVAFNRGPVADEADAGLVSPVPVSEAAAKPLKSERPRDLEIGPSGIAIPVVGIEPDDLVNTYKHARGGGSRVHDAIDIMAPHGTPVVSAAPGIVEKLFFSNGGGGVSAYVRSHDKRFIFYYSHLQDYARGLKEGQAVRQGDPIGRVGSTGNANPAGPHLHFAVHRMAPGEKWHQGRPLNPYPLLVGGRGSR
jgi:murein DD-endopeptidase MepM/ murein hydrolase activator NlpD